MGGAISDSDRCGSVTLYTNDSVQLPGNIILLNINYRDSESQYSNLFYYYKNENKLMGTYTSKYVDINSSTLTQSLNILVNDATLNQYNELILNIYYNGEPDLITICTIDNGLLIPKMYSKNYSTTYTKQITINYMVLS